jgi:hypothetical protein
VSVPLWIFMVRGRPRCMAYSLRFGKCKKDEWKTIDPQKCAREMLGLSFFISRLPKNAHLLRCPTASPCWRRGKVSLLIRRDATPPPSPYQARGRLVAAYSAKYASIHISLGLRISGALHLAIFEQPGGPFCSFLIPTLILNLFQDFFGISVSEELV